MNKETCTNDSFKEIFKDYFVIFAFSALVFVLTFMLMLAVGEVLDWLLPESVQNFLWDFPGVFIGIPLFAVGATAFFVVAGTAFVGMVLSVVGLLQDSFKLLWRWLKGSST